MNEKLTREVLEDMAMCREIGCQGCRGVCKCDTMGSGIETLAKALLAEMDKPKDDVWNNAPIDSMFADVIFRAKNERVLDTGTRYRRELPKSRIDEIAEEAREKLRDYLFVKEGQESSVVDDIIKSAILKDREEREANQ